MKLVLFDTPNLKTSLLPLTFTRPISNLRVGIFTITEKWEKYFENTFSFLVDKYLSTKFPLNLVDNTDFLFINGAICPDENLVENIKKLPLRTALVKDNLVLAYYCHRKDIHSFCNDFNVINTIDYANNFTLIASPQDIFIQNGAQIRADYKLISQNYQSEILQDKHTVVYGNDLFIEKGAVIRASILNTESGPIYIGKNAEIGEGSMIRGPFAIGESGALNLGAKMRGDVTVGPFSKVGGEVSNSVFLANSNKAHDGYLGNSVIGEYCNFGAGASNSNMKNTISNVKLWNYLDNDFSDTSRKFCGCIVGDHSKIGINTVINTGTVIGVGANVISNSFPPKFIPSFTWLNQKETSIYRFEKALLDFEEFMKLKKNYFTEDDKKIVSYIYQFELNQLNLTKAL